MVDWLEQLQRLDAAGIGVCRRKLWRVCRVKLWKERNVDEEEAEVPAISGWK